MELSNLRPAEGSKHSDNFRRGRGHGSGNGKTKILGNGELTKKLNVKVNAVSETAKSKIEAAGGTVEVI